MNGGEIEKREREAAAEESVEAWYRVVVVKPLKNEEDGDGDDDTGKEDEEDAIYLIYI